MLEILCKKGGTKRSAGKVATPLIAEASEEETERLKEEVQDLQIKYERLEQQLEQRLEQPKKVESKSLERLRKHWEQKETEGDREDLADS